MTNIALPVVSWAQREPDAPALTVGERRWTRLELCLDAARASSWLEDRGVARGDRVVITGSISASWCVLALGALQVGATLVPLNERLTPAEIAQIIERAAPSLVVADAARSATVTAARSELPAIPAAELPEDPAGFGAAADASRETADTSRDEVAVLVFTSGSTGLPKGVPLTHGTITEAFFEWVLQEPGLLRAHALNVSSLAFLGGLFNGFLAPLVFGGRTTMLPAWDPEAALALLRTEGITSMASTTIFYEQMAALPAFARADLSGVRVALAGGNPVPVALLDAWRQRGVLLRQVYGLTEGCSVVSLPPSEVAAGHPDAAGLGGIMRRITVVDADDRPLPPEEPGEIVLAGAGLADAYFGDPESTAYEFRNGRLHTGDVGVFDDGGRLRIVGRVKDVIISGGLNIYAAELERVIAELDGIEEVAVVGVPDERFGEAPAAIVNGTPVLTEEAIIDHCRMRLARYKAPRYAEFVDAPLPRTVLGKVDKGPLREAYVDLPQVRAKNKEV